MAQHNIVRLARAEMMKAETSDGHDADDERKAWMDSKKAVKLANIANEKMDKAREASAAKAKATDDAKMQKAIAKEAKMQKVKAKKEATIKAKKIEEQIEEQIEERNHAARMRAADKMIMKAKELMVAKEEQFMQTPLTSDPEAVRLLTDANHALQTWEQKVKTEDGRMTNDEKDTDMESVDDDDKPLVQPGVASHQGNLFDEVKQGLASRLKHWSPEEAFVPTEMEIERMQKTGLPLEVIKMSRDRKKKSAERTALRQLEANLASGAQQITVGQESTHALHKYVSNYMICFIICV